MASCFFPFRVASRYSNDHVTAARYRRIINTLYFIRRRRHSEDVVKNFGHDVRYWGTRTQSASQSADDEGSSSKAASVMTTIFSGIQPTSGSLHLGNYVGAVSQWVRLQRREPSERILICLADLHSITLPSDRPERLGDNTLQIAACLLACGIDPQRTVLFQQSQVPQHAELAWVLTCLTTMPRLGRLSQYKEKAEKFKTEQPLGLFVYPVLQSADILLYKSTQVPVGEDQLQHIQLAQHLANTFNRKYGFYFPRPIPLLGEKPSTRLKSLRDPSKKMSKSDPDPRSRIELSDSEDATVEKIKKAVSDCTSAVTYEQDTRPGVVNLIDIECLLTNKSAERVCDESRGLETAQYKIRLAEVVNETLRPTRSRLERLMKDPGHVRSVIREGSDRAREIATGTWTDVRRIVGFDTS